VSDSWLETLISRHAKSGILLDSNLLLLYLVGSLDPDLVPKEKGTRDYTPDDFRLVSEFLGRFDHLITTPNIMSEVSNLAGRLREHTKHVLHVLIRTRFLELVRESHVATRDASAHFVFDRLGVTDAAIGMLADRGILVFTNDLDLSIALESRQMDCVHYDRMFRPFVLNIN
jgi:predicted nucleic acid-binding protein